LRHHTTSQKVVGSIPDIILLATLGTDPASNCNEYQEYFPEGKGSRCNLQVPNVSKSGSLNLLEPSGPVIGLHRDCYLTYVHTYAHTHTHTRMCIRVYVYIYSDTSANE